MSSCRLATECQPRPEKKAYCKDSMESKNKGGTNQAILESEHDSRNARVPINVVDLPIDILYNIFDYFQGDEVTFWGKGEWRVNFNYRRASGRSTVSINHRQTIQSARLVCRICHQLASPLLCPIVQVRLDQASLERTNHLSRSPLIAAGIHGIQVVLDYRPREFSTDLSRFKDQRKKDSKEIHRRCDYFAETWVLGGNDKDDDTICPEPYREYIKTMELYWSICLAWDNCVNPVNENGENKSEEHANEENTNEENAEILKYQRLLRQCHEEYQQKHEEQFRLIMDGSFFDILALAMSRMAHCGTLQFAENMENYLDPYIRNPTTLLNNTEALFRLMVKPQNWRTIEEIEGGAELLPAKCLSELPIAIHKSGAALGEVEITCFSITNNYSIIRLDLQDRLDPALVGLREACQQLKIFKFRGWGRINRSHRHLGGKERSPIKHCFRAMLSNQSLEVVDLNFVALRVHDGRRGTDGGRYRIGSILETVNWPHIKRITIERVSLHQHELERFAMAWALV
jgi:hypothetical protein